MDKWFNIDLKEGSRFEAVSGQRISWQLVLLYLIVSSVASVLLYMLCVKWLWTPLSVMLLFGLCLLSIRNVLIYLLPPHLLRYLQQKARKE